MTDRPTQRPHDEKLLPERTLDESPEGWGERPDESDDEERYLRERPPHHGD
jgi:hypothetical protein